MNRCANQKLSHHAHGMVSCGVILISSGERPGPHRITTMNLSPDTIEALTNLAKALDANPDDVDTLEDYGYLPTHLDDVMEDLKD